MIQNMSKPRSASSATIRSTRAIGAELVSVTRSDAFRDLFRAMLCNRLMKASGSGPCYRRPRQLAIPVGPRFAAVTVKNNSPIAINLNDFDGRVANRRGLES
jgi:hypothetical protein